MSAPESGAGEDCCEYMHNAVTRTCDHHPDRYDCPDVMVVWSQQQRRYGLPVRDGGQSFIEIDRCPWCGAVLSSTARSRTAPVEERYGRDREELCRILHAANTGKICPDPDDPTNYVAMAEAVLERVGGTLPDEVGA